LTSLVVVPPLYETVAPEIAAPPAAAVTLPVTPPVIGVPALVMIGHRDNVFLRDQILRRHVPVVGDESGPPVVAVLRDALG